MNLAARDASRFRIFPEREIPNLGGDFQIHSSSFARGLGRYIQGQTADSRGEASRPRLHWQEAEWGEGALFSTEVDLVFN